MIKNPSTIQNKRGARKYVHQPTKEDPSLREEKIAEEARWDGIYGITTSKCEMTAQEILAAYKNLWRIEEAFRVLKFSLQTRPIFHWNAKRIKGHLVACFLAFLLERTLEIELARQNIDYSVTRIREAIHDLQASLIECQGNRFLLRSKISELGKKILTTLQIKTPPACSPHNEFPHA